MKNHNKSTQIVSAEPQNKNLVNNTQLYDAGQIANTIASEHVFRRFAQEKSEGTIKRHARDLKLFAEYLLEMSVQIDNIDFQRDPNAWHGVTWGLIEGFVAWLLQKGFAINSVNSRLSTVRVYAKLAVRSGVISQEEGLLIQNIKGFSRKTGLNVDDHRGATRKVRASYSYTTPDQSREIHVERRSTKKTAATQISVTVAVQATSMRNSSPQAARDALLMCLLLEHGLRASEIPTLLVSSIDLKDGFLKFTRPKVRGTDHEHAIHKMTRKTLVVATTYIHKFYPPTLLPHGPLILATTRLKKDGSGGDLRTNGLNRVRVSERVAYIGRELGIEKFSAHDCRHYCATKMAHMGYGVHELMAWFGWTNAQTAMKYVHAAEVLVRDKG